MIPLRHFALAALSAALVLIALPAAKAEGTDLVSLMHELAPLLKSGRGHKGFPMLSDADLQKIDSGKVVLREFPVAGKEVPRTVLARVLPYPIEAIYLVIADLQGQVRWVPGLSHSFVVGKEKGGMVLHGYQLMKAPTNDRSWVTRVVNNTDLYKATGGRYWEVWWTLMDDKMKAYSWPAVSEDEARRAQLTGIDDDTLKEAIQPKYSDGAWVLLRLDDKRTYVEYDSFSDPNLGSLEKLGAWAFGSAVMKDMLDDLGPYAKAYAEKKATPPAYLVDMEGAPAKGLLGRMP